MELTAQQKLTLHVMRVGAHSASMELPEFTCPDEIVEFYNDFDEEHEKHEEFQDACHDGCDEVRGGEVETGIVCASSRHYESKSVAVEIDGTWIGWTYWYGGGKHGEAYDVEWIKEAYYLEYTEEKKIVRSFTKKA